MEVLKSCLEYGVICFFGLGSKYTSLRRNVDSAKRLLPCLQGEKFEVEVRVDGDHLCFHISRCISCDDIVNLRLSGLGTWHELCRLSRGFGPRVQNA